MHLYLKFHVMQWFINWSILVGEHEFWAVKLIYEKHAPGNLLATAQQFCH